jgi:hypothetical protein
MVAPITGIPCDVPVPKIYLQLLFNFFTKNRINSLSLETYLTNFVIILAYLKYNGYRNKIKR